MTKEKRKKLLIGSNLIGSNVLSPDQEEIGTVKDIAIDPLTGKIIYATITFGGFMGFGEKRFAMPWPAFYLDTLQDDVVILNVDKEKLENAPGLEDDELPLTAQWEFVDRTYRYYGFEEYTLRRPVGRNHQVPLGKSESNFNAGLGNSGKQSTFEKAGFDSNRIKETGIA